MFNSSVLSPLAHVFLVEDITDVDNIERRYIFFATLSNEERHPYISDLKKPGRFELWTPVIVQFKYMQVRRTPQVFFSCVCIEDVCKFKLFLAFPFGVKIVDKPQVWCASKANTVDNPQPQPLRALYDTLIFCFGEQQINKQRLVRKLVKNSQMNEKISQWSYRFWMYKVKWWLKMQWKLIHRFNMDYRTLKLKILQAI